MKRVQSELKTQSFKKSDTMNTIEQSPLKEDQGDAAGAQPGDLEKGGLKEDRERVGTGANGMFTSILLLIYISTTPRDKVLLT